MFNTIPDLVFRVDINGEFLDYKADIKDLYYQKDSIIGKNYHDILPPSLIDILDKYIPITIQTSEIQTFEYTLSLPDGITHEYEIRMSKSGINEVTAIIREITEQKKWLTDLLDAKNIAETNEQRLKEAQSLAKIGDWELNLVKNHLSWSDEIYRIFNCKPQEFGATYEAFLGFIHPEDRELVNNTYTTHLKTKEPYNIVHRVLLENGEIKYVNERCKTEFDENGNAIRSLGTVADVTEQILNEIELLQAKERAEESDRLKNQFFLNMSHEIKSPMNSIIGFSNLLNKKDLSDEKKQHYTSIIINSTNQLRSIVENIITTSMLETKQEKVVLIPVNINNLLEHLYHEFSIIAQNRNIKFSYSIDLPGEKSVVISDKIKIEQILINLISNALKFTREGEIEYGYFLKDTTLQFYVKDTGIGIQPEMKEKIFKEFIQEETGFTREFGGNGLGLSISKGFVELLDGNIWLESEAGTGSTFYFSIPYKTN